MAYIEHSTWNGRERQCNVIVRNPKVSSKVYFDAMKREFIKFYCHLHKDISSHCQLLFFPFFWEIFYIPKATEWVCVSSWNQLSWSFVAKKEQFQGKKLSFEQWRTWVKDYDHSTENAVVHQHGSISFCTLVFSNSITTVNLWNFIDTRSWPSHILKHIIQRETVSFCLESGIIRQYLCEISNSLLLISSSCIAKPIYVTERSGKNHKFLFFTMCKQLGAGVRGGIHAPQLYSWGS